MSESTEKTAAEKTAAAREAVQMAGVDPQRADAWLEGVDRPAWLTARAQAARISFETANLAVEELRSRLAGETDPPIPLRDLLSIADHLYATALRLDRDVAGG